MKTVNSKKAVGSKSGSRVAAQEVPWTRKDSQMFGQFEARDLAGVARAAGHVLRSIEGELAGGGTRAEERLEVLSAEAKRLVGKLEAVALELEDQFERVMAEETNAATVKRFMVQSVEKRRDTKLRCPVAVMRLAIEGGKKMTVRLPICEKRTVELAFFMRALGYTFGPYAEVKPDWKGMNGKEGRCRMDGKDLILLVPELDGTGDCRPFMIHPAAA